MSKLEAELDAIAGGTPSLGILQAVGGQDGVELAKAYGPLATL